MTKLEVSMGYPALSLVLGLAFIFLFLVWLLQLEDIHGRLLGLNLKAHGFFIKSKN